MNAPIARPDPAALDLDAYFARIGYAPTASDRLSQLEMLHLAHATQIPFENLDILLGRPIRLDLASLQAKLVRGGRGGYCFEHNLLFAAVLRALGFDVTALAARVRVGAVAPVSPRTHMLLRVEVDGAAWIADVGFGAGGLLLPVRLEPGHETRQFEWTYRVAEADGNWTLQTWRPEGWADMYVFTMEPQHDIDFEVANHYVSTHPASRFVQTLTAQRVTPQAHHALRNREYTIDRGGEVTRTQVTDDDALLDLLEAVFGLAFAPGTRFPLRA